MLDPTAGGGGANGGGAPGFAEEAQRLPPDVAQAYASVLKAPAAASFDQRWRAWGAGFGGSSQTNGDPAVGSSNVTASEYGYAAGMDYRVTPDTLFGFALAGGGTGWSLAQGLGTGRSDAFQAGLYGKSYFGPAYLSGALALPTIGSPPIALRSAISSPPISPARVMRRAAKPAIATGCRSPASSPASRPMRRCRRRTSIRRATARPISPAAALV